MSTVKVIESGRKGTRKRNSRKKPASLLVREQVCEEGEAKVLVAEWLLENAEKEGIAPLDIGDVQKALDKQSWGTPRAMIPTKDGDTIFLLSYSMTVMPANIPVVSYNAAASGPVLIGTWYVVPPDTDTEQLLAMI